MQMAFYMLTHCGMINILHLDKLDCLSMLIGAVCHDLGHDGFNNSYHMNAILLRAKLNFVTTHLLIRDRPQIITYASNI